MLSPCLKLLVQEPLKGMVGISMTYLDMMYSQSTVPVSRFWMRPMIHRSQTDHDILRR